MTNIADNLQHIESKIRQFSQNAKRDINSVQLLAVSKTKPIELIEQAYLCGQRDFGESYAQEAVDKITSLCHLNDICWHFIGPIQSNKTRLIANHFHWVHSLDREKIALRLNEQRSADLPPLNVLIQVNISEEASKSGITASMIAPLAKTISQCPRLHLRGLMAIGEKNIDNRDNSPNFIKMANLFKQLQSEYPEVDTLSMGMSADMLAAIEAGSTIVRIGSAIFGKRSW
jgi:pyridoxal phosphate enzyme (YggS family)